VTINPKFIDVDFTKDPKYVRGDLPLPALERGRFARYGDSIDVIPESQWKELIALMDADGGGADRLVTRIYNQLSEGSCVANACSQAVEVCQAKQFGKDKVVHLSAISLYKRIGRSPGSGAMVSDGLDELSTKGILPLDNPENRAKFGDKVMPNTGFYTAYPTGWEEVAKQFHGTEWFIVESVEELITALLNQHPVVVGRAGHSICYTRPMYDSGSLVVKYANSWGDWGDKGFGYDSMGLIRSSASWAFALRQVNWRPT
jgi:hypothetical protein